MPKTRILPKKLSSRLAEVKHVFPRLQHLFNFPQSFRHHQISWLTSCIFAGSPPILSFVRVASEVPNSHGIQSRPPRTEVAAAVLVHSIPAPASRARGGWGRRWTSRRRDEQHCGGQRPTRCTTATTCCYCASSRSLIRVDQQSEVIL